MVDFLVQIISFELNCINFHLHPVEKCSTDIRLVVLSSCRNIHIVCVYWQNYLISAYCHIPYLVAVELADRQPAAGARALQELLLRGLHIAELLFKWGNQLLSLFS